MATTYLSSARLDQIAAAQADFDTHVTLSASDRCRSCGVEGTVRRAAPVGANPCKLRPVASPDAGRRHPDRVRPHMPVEQRREVHAAVLHTVHARGPSYLLSLRANWVERRPVRR